MGSPRLMRWPDWGVWPVTMALGEGVVRTGAGGGGAGVWPGKKESW